MERLSTVPNTVLLRNAVSSHQFVLLQDDGLTENTLVSFLQQEGLDYICVFLTETVSCAPILWDLAQELYFSGNLKELSVYYDRISGSVYGAGLNNYHATAFMHEVLNAINIKGKYVLFFQPYSRLIADKDVLLYLQQISNNHLYPNLTFISLVKDDFLFDESSICPYKKYTMRRQTIFPCIYISYKWSDIPNHIVMNNLVPELESLSLEYKLDKKDCGYMKDICEFEEEIGTGEKIIAVVSRSYFYSIHCMYEIACIIKNGELLNRLFLIVLDDFDRNDATLFSELLEYWDKELQKKNSILVDTPDNLMIQNEGKKIDAICGSINKFWEYLRSENTLSLTELGRDHFKVLFDRMGIPRTQYVQMTGESQINPELVRNATNVYGDHAQVFNFNGSGAIEINVPRHDD